MSWSQSVSFSTNALPHTAHAALTGLKKKGHVIVRDKVGSVTVYKVSA